MPFDPTLPANLSVIDAEELRAQFNALKALIDAGQSGGVSVPIGAVIPWFKDTPGVPALPDNFVECNGQVLNDPDSPLDGQSMPEINTGFQPRFIRGNTISGGTGGWDQFGTATADFSNIGTTVTVVSPDFSPGASPLPPYISAVYVIRVK